MDTDTTNLVEGGDTSTDTAAADTGVEPQAPESTEPQFDDDGNPIEEPEEDEEVELDEDLKLKVPKTQAQKVKEALLRQADYTRKTQELAEQRKALTAEHETLVNTSNAEFTAFARVQTIGEQLQSYQKVNWEAELAAAQANYDDDREKYINREYMKFQQLKDTYNGSLGELSRLRNERLSTAQQETAKRMEEGRAVLTKEIGWNDDLKAKLLGFAAEFGFSRDDLDDLEADPRAARVLHAAYEGLDAKRKAAAANKHVQDQQVTPSAQVKANTPPPQGLSDRLSADEWVKRRNDQLRKRG